MFWGSIIIIRIIESQKIVDLFKIWITISLDKIFSVASINNQQWMMTVPSLPVWKLPQEEDETNLIILYQTVLGSWVPQDLSKNSNNCPITSITRPGRCRFNCGLLIDCILSMNEKNETNTVKMISAKQIRTVIINYYYYLLLLLSWRNTLCYDHISISPPAYPDCWRCPGPGPPRGAPAQPPALAPGPAASVCPRRPPWPPLPAHDTRYMIHNTWHMIHDVLVTCQLTRARQCSNEVRAAGWGRRSPVWTEAG